MRPYYEDASVTLYLGDCREVLPSLPRASVGVCVTDPPYGETSLSWDVRVDGWAELVKPLLRKEGSLWCFGSMRFAREAKFEDWTLAQDIVWEKHNGSNAASDRFRRVHEHALHFYPETWEQVHKSVQTQRDARRRVVRRKERPPHWGEIADSTYQSEDGGPRLMRSVLQVRSCHGYAIHKTQKPLGILTPLIEYSCPPDGIVLDPFAGSCSSLLAAKVLGRRAIGIEVDEAMCEKASERFQQEVLAL